MCLFIHLYLAAPSSSRVAGVLPATPYGIVSSGAVWEYDIAGRCSVYMYVCMHACTALHCAALVLAWLFAYLPLSLVHVSKAMCTWVCFRFPSFVCRTSHCSFTFTHPTLHPLLTYRRRQHRGPVC